MTSLDTLKQAAQALRDEADDRLDFVGDEYRKLAAALEAMAEQKPVYQIAKATGPAATAWIDVDEATVNSAALHPDDFRIRALYTAPIATPEHDAKVRDAALEEAAQLCERLGHGLDNWNRPYVRHHEVVQAMHRIRKLKTIGANHAK